MSERICSVHGCGEKHYGRGWCRRHYDIEWRRAGGFERQTVEVSERFWSKVDKEAPLPLFAPHLGNCWGWTAKKDKKGYGRFGLTRKQASYLAYVWAYETEVGPVPDGLELDHLCRVRSCVRPSHLEPVTHQENMARSERAMRTHCPQGHEYTEANTDRWNGKRRCRRCHAIREAARGREKRRQRREAQRQ